MRIENLTKRQATRTIDGVSFPVIIKNQHFYLSNLMVFEDGLIDCWETLDLPLFEEKLLQGWVNTSIPEGDWLRLSQIGHLQVVDAEWTTSEDDLFKAVDDLITQLNPDRVNLYDMQGSSTEQIGFGIYRKEDRLQSPSWILQDEQSGFFDRSKGRTQWAFEQTDIGFDVVEVALFENNTVHIVGPSGIRALTLDVLGQEAAAGQYAFPKTGDRVAIAGLGSFTVGETEGYGFSGERLMGDLEETSRQLKGLPTSYEHCREVFDAYLADPNRANLNRVKEAYEAVPQHLKRYCGDMDNKDIPIRILLYGDKEIESWSHWQAAKFRDLPLPTLEVPRPVD